MFTNVLLAYDGSDHAKAALAQAADIGRTQNAQLTVVTAFSTELAWPVIIAPGMSKDLYDGFLEASRCGAQTTLDEA